MDLYAALTGDTSITTDGLYTGTMVARRLCRAVYVIVHVVIHVLYLLNSTVNCNPLPRAASLPPLTTAITTGER